MQFYHAITKTLLSHVTMASWHCCVNKCIVCIKAPCGLWGIMHPWFDFLFRLYIYCLVTSYAPHLSFFLTYLLPYLSFPLRIDLLRFQAGCHKRRLNLALAFCVSLDHFGFVFSNFVLLGLVFSVPSQELGREERLINDAFCVEWDVKLYSAQFSLHQMRAVFVCRNAGWTSRLTVTTTSLQQLGRVKL